jgi:hypothetical protein
MIMALQPGVSLEDRGSKDPIEHQSCALHGTSGVAGAMLAIVDTCGSDAAFGRMWGEGVMWVVVTLLHSEIANVIRDWHIILRRLPR